MPTTAPDTNFGGRAGDHHDALYYYGLSATGTRDDNSSTRGLLVMNHENITQIYLHPNGPSPAPRPEGEVLKEMEAHGVSIVEISANSSNVWSYNQASPLNRRITVLTGMQLNGPVTGNALVRTAFRQRQRRPRHR
jgi:secreted PhoX family phosphatase